MDIFLVAVTVLTLVGVFSLATRAKALLTAISGGKEEIMGQLEDLQAAVAAARAELEADKAAILTEIARLGLPDADLTGVIAAVNEFGTVLDDVPGVTPMPVPEPVPVPEPEPIPEPEPEPVPEEPIF